MKRLNQLFDSFARTLEPYQVPSAVERLRPHRRKLERLYQEMLTEEEREGWPVDRRTGVETYGYKSLEDIAYRLHYISDRWRAPFRIRWVLDLLDLDLLTIPFYDRLQKNIIVAEELYDVVGVNLESRQVIEILAENKTKKNAYAIEDFAVIRRGVDDRFYTSVPAGSFTVGDTYQR